MPSTYDVKAPKTGTIYRYNSISYWDKEKKRPRSKNEYLGKVDPITGELIPKKERKKKSETQPHETTTQMQSDAEKSHSLEERIHVLEMKIAELEKERIELKEKLRALAEGIS